MTAVSITGAYPLSLATVIKDPSYIALRNLTIILLQRYHERISLICIVFTRQKHCLNHLRLSIEFVCAHTALKWPENDSKRLLFGYREWNHFFFHSRFRRERLSLYATTNHRQTSRRSRSVGITGAESRQRQRNGHGPKTTANYSDADSKSDSDSEYEEVFKPIAQQTTTASPTTKSSAMSYENQAFNPETPTEVNIDGDGEEKESTAVTALSNCNHSNNKDNIEDGGNDDQPMSTTTIQTCVSILETIVTDSETGANQNLSNGDHHSQLGLIKNAHYKKFSSPPVLRRNNSTGSGGGHSNKKILSSKIPPSTLAPTKTKNNGLTTTTIDILSANEMSPEHILENKRRRSNNHLYPPHSDGIT